MELNQYWISCREEVEDWKKQMQQEPNFQNRIAKAVQRRINNLIPEKVHQVISNSIKQMIRAMIFGSIKTTKKVYPFESLEKQDSIVNKRIQFYSTTAAAEGAATGAGGILLGLADFPIWLSLKMKLLHEIANIYGYDIKDYKERIFLLYIFQLTFSSQIQRNKTFPILLEWQYQKEALPDDINTFDWKTFQIEYRDYLDIAKLFQMIPGLGAPIGAYVNHRLTKKLGTNAMRAFHMRMIQELDS